MFAPHGMKSNVLKQGPNTRIIAVKIIGTNQNKTNKHQKTCFALCLTLKCGLVAARTTVAMEI